MMHVVMMVVFKRNGDPRDLHVLTHPFPPRRPSDLSPPQVNREGAGATMGSVAAVTVWQYRSFKGWSGSCGRASAAREASNSAATNNRRSNTIRPPGLRSDLDANASSERKDRKSTRLNSSH